MKVIYFSDVNKSSVARDYTRALGRINGMELTSMALEDAVDPSISGFDVAVYQGAPHQLATLAQVFEERRITQMIAAPKRMKQVGVTTWETSRLPGALAKPLGLLDAVIVPSTFCQEIFAGALTAKHTSVHRVPYCFDPAEWEINNKPQGDRFTFYTIGNYGERKNVLGVLRAYLHEFSREDKVRLVILSHGIQFDAVKKTLTYSGIPLDQMPALVIPDGVFSREEIVRLHQDSDCFVSATRCESWGLELFQALIMQRPVVAPAYGGQREFLPVMKTLAPRSVPYHLTPVWGGGQDADARQLWAEPDLSTLAHRMRDTYELFKDNRDYSDFEDYRIDLEDRYSAPVVGQQFFRVLKEL